MEKCIDCGLEDLVFEGENEYEPDPVTGEPRCFNCDLRANPSRYDEDREKNCECGLNEQGVWKDEVFDRFGCGCPEKEVAV